MLNVNINDFDRDSIMQVLMMVEDTTENDYARRRETSLREQLAGYPAERINGAVEKLVEAGVLEIDAESEEVEINAAGEYVGTVEAINDADIKPKAKANGSMSAKALALQMALSDLIEIPDAAMDEGAVIKLIQAEIAKLEIPRPTLLEIKQIDGSMQTLGMSHAKLETLIKVCSARVNVLLVGPAGSGKTYAAEQVAKAFSLPLYFNGAISSEYKLSGFIDAQGRLVSTAFREAYENGGVYLFDEVDGSLPAATLAFNAALANGFADFPDGRVNRHDDFICIAAANTYGGGATFDFVGRNKQDGAFMDRFATLRWDIDEALEIAACANTGWVRKVQRWRANAASKGLKVIISPRASFNGAKLLAAGLDEPTVAEMTVVKGMTPDQWASIR